MAHREEDLGSESKTINAVVNALAEQAAHASASEESVSIRSIIQLLQFAQSLFSNFVWKKKEQIFIHIILSEILSENQRNKSISCLYNK